MNVHSDIKQQYIRLKNHYELSSTKHDKIAFLDLAHSLRIWTEMKQQISELESKTNKHKMFITGALTKSIKRTLKNTKYIAAYFPKEAVELYNVVGVDFKIPVDENECCVHAIEVMKDRHNTVFLRKFILVFREINQNELKSFFYEKQKPLSYSEWLGSEIVRINYVNTAGELQEYAISRDKLIRRVANILGASHFPADKSYTKTDGFDNAINQLMQFEIFGIPLPYFLLISIAKTIISNCNNLIEN